MQIEYYYNTEQETTFFTDVKVDIPETEPQIDYPQEQSSSPENESMLYLFNS